MIQYILLKHEYNGTLKLLRLLSVDMERTKRAGYKEVIRGGWKECKAEYDNLLN